MDSRIVTLIVTILSSKAEELRGHFWVKHICIGERWVHNESVFIKYCVIWHYARHLEIKQCSDCSGGGGGGRECRGLMVLGKSKIK